MSIRRYSYAFVLSAVALFATMVDATHIHTDNQFDVDCSICLQDTNQHSGDNTDTLELPLFSPLQITLEPTSFIAKSSDKFSNPRAPPVIS